MIIRAIISNYVSLSIGSQPVCSPVSPLIARMHCKLSTFCTENLCLYDTCRGDCQVPPSRYMTRCFTGLSTCVSSASISAVCRVSGFQVRKLLPVNEVTQHVSPRILLRNGARRFDWGMIYGSGNLFSQRTQHCWQ